MKPYAIGIALVVCACSAPPPSVTGVWKGQVTNADGETHDLAFSFEARGDSLTGSVLGVPDATTQPIENGRIAQDDVSFAIHLTRPEGETATLAVTARVAGNRLRGSITGLGRTFQLTATRTSASPGSLAGTETGRRTTHAMGDTSPPNPQGANPTPQNAVQAVLAAFDRYEVVAMGILSYANQDFDQFILDLIRDPAFPGRVNDIAVECGNSLYQPILDRYIAGDSVPPAAMRQVSRNTTQPFCGVTTFYEELFPLVRRINETLPADRKLRVLAGDPPVDWSTVTTARDLRPSENRDANIAAVMEREVLAKHRKALMIFGVRHLMHGGRGAVGTYERADFAHRTFVVMAHNGFGTGSPLARHNGALERRMAGWPVPSLVPLRGTWLDDLPWPYFFPGEDEHGARLSAAVDAYLYLGPGDFLLNDPIPARIILDTAYMAALRHRARIRKGPMDLHAVMREAANPSVFFNQSGGP